jgi:hypothetical protein
VAGLSTPARLDTGVVTMRPENLTIPDTGDRADPFRNNPRQRSEVLAKVNIGDAPRKLPPKVAGVYTHGSECACWVCEDETPAERLQVGATA